MTYYDLTRPNPFAIIELLKVQCASAARTGVITVIKWNTKQ